MQIVVFTVFTIKAIQSPRSGYPLMAISMLFYLLAFIPFIILTYYGSFRIELNQELVSYENLLRVTHNVLLAISSAIYAVVIMKFVYLKDKILRIANPTVKSLSTTIMILFVFLWCLLCFGGLVAIPLLFHQSSTIWAGAIWALFVTSSDFLVMNKLINILIPLSAENYRKTRAELREFQRSHLILCIGAAVVFLLVILMLVAGTIYQSDSEMRRLIYRIAFCFSPLWHVNHLVFMMLCEKMFNLA